MDGHLEVEPLVRGTGGFRLERGVHWKGELVQRHARLNETRQPHKARHADEMTQDRVRLDQRVRHGGEKRRDGGVAK